MTPVRPEELSALLDGEMDVEREREIRAQLAASPELRAEFEMLSQLDGKSRAAAATATFSPSIRMSAAHAPRLRTVVIVLVVSMLLLVRLVPKFFDALTLAWTLNMAALVLVLTVTVWLLRDEGAQRVTKHQPILGSRVPPDPSCRSAERPRAAVSNKT